MKLIKNLVAGAILAATLAQTASAANPANHIYITGSTAFRTAAIAAISQVLGLPQGSLGGGTGNDSNNGGANSNTSFIWSGGTINSTSVTVCATFTGSETGCASVAGSQQIPFLPDGVTGETNASCYSDVQSSQPNPNYTTAIPDICFSDVYQGTTPFNGNVTLASGSTTNFVAMTNKPVGMPSFKWIASVGFPLGTGSSGSTVTTSSYSMEPNFLAYLYGTNGVAPLSMMVGSTGSTDQTVEIFATGRNPDSGTRATALADGFFGVANPVFQWQQTGLSGSTVTSMQLFPIQTIAGLSTSAAGNSGEGSGANLRAYGGYTISSSLYQDPGFTTAAYFVMYLGISDAGKVEGTSKSGAVELAYKGVNYSNAAIYSGQYTYWSIEHLYYRTNIATNPKALATAVVTNLTTSASGANLGYSNVSGVGFTANDPNWQVTRSGDGTSTIPNFTY